MVQRTTRRQFLEGGKTLALGCLSTCGIPGTLVTASAGPAGEERFVEPVLPNRYEREAVARGQELGIGAAVLDGPATIEVCSHQTWTLVYTAGKAGVRAGGGLRIAMRHLAHQWSSPQVNRPRERNYLTIEAERGQPVELTIDFRVRSRFFTQYFAWQNIVEVLLPERGLEAGETLRVTFGDRSGGSPGLAVQPFCERRFVFKCYADVEGGGEFLPLARSPAVEIVAAQPHRLNVVAPSDAVTSKPTWFLVRAEDRYGNPAPCYRGTVRLHTPGGPEAKCYAEHTFTADDQGVFRFEDVILAEPGVHTLVASDGRFEARSNPVVAGSDPPEKRLLWGDLHGHTLFSDGRGTVEEYYDFAERVAGLDICAVSDHAFEIVDEMWEHSKEVTNAVYRPGSFVTLQAYEWSGNTNVGGDHNVYFLEDDPPLYRSGNYYDRRNLQMYHGPKPNVPHVKELFERLAQRLGDRDVLCIPHIGGRRGNPEFHHPDVRRAIEIFSEHRRSEAWAGTFLARGQRLAIMASSDNHYGSPGYGYLRPTGDWSNQEIGMGLIGVYAPERTREAVFRALYDRHVYATSGARIVLQVFADGRPMGSEFRTARAPLISIRAVGTTDIARVEINKNGEVVWATTPNECEVQLEWSDRGFNADDPSLYYVRVVQTDREEAISSPIWVN